MREAWYLRGGGESQGGGKENRSGSKSSSAVLVKYITEGTEVRRNVAFEDSHRSDSEQIKTNGNGAYLPPHCMSSHWHMNLRRFKFLQCFSPPSRSFLNH